MPAKYAPILFGLLLSGFMSLMVSGVSTLGVLGLTDGFFSAWMGNWSNSWAVAFPTVLIIAPVVRRIVAKLVREN